MNSEFLAVHLDLSFPQLKRPVLVVLIGVFLGLHHRFDIFLLSVDRLALSHVLERQTILACCVIQQESDTLRIVIDPSGKFGEVLELQIARSIDRSLDIIKSVEFEWHFRIFIPCFLDVILARHKQEACRLLL